MSLRSSLNEGGDSQFEARGAVTPTFVARNSAPVHAALCRVVDSFDGTGSPTSVDSDGLPRRAASDDYFSRSRARPWEVKIASHVGSDLTFWRAEVIHTTRRRELLVEMIFEASVLIAGVACTAALVWMKFIVIPLTIAYFLTYLLAPLVDMFEQRPTQRCAESSNALRARGYSRHGGLKGCMQNLLCLGKLPHSLALLVTLVVAASLVVAMYLILEQSIEGYLKNGNALEFKFYEMERQGFKKLRDAGVNVVPNATFIGEGEPTTVDDIKGMGSVIMMITNEILLVLLLAMYLLLDRLPGSTMRGDSVAMQEIEQMCKHYVTLKTYISAATGIICGVILFLLNVKLAPLWGLLSFVLNFIPNVGSMVAIMLPMPVAMLDDDLSVHQKLGAFLYPGLVQTYVGNFLEPRIFGHSLNMTPISILCALVFFGLLWGLPGAVLSVPFLGIMKVLLQKSDHRIAVGLYCMIRESADIDETVAREQTDDLGEVFDLIGDAFNDLLAISLGFKITEDGIQEASASSPGSRSPGSAVRVGQSDDSQITPRSRHFAGHTQEFEDRVHKDVGRFASNMLKTRTRMHSNDAFQHSGEEEWNGTVGTDVRRE